MAIQIICIGTELLTGEIVNTNLAFIAAELNRAGLKVDSEISIHDEPDTIAAALKNGFAENNLVVTVGGLGPTKDDITKETAADVLDVDLVTDDDLAEVIRQKYARYRSHLPNSGRMKQATVPEGATILPNNWGTAPGLWCERNGKAILMLPGPPRELEPIFTEFAMPRILQLIPPSISRRNLAVFGVGESTVEERVLKALQSIADVEPSYCVKLDCCHVRLTVPTGNEALLSDAEAALRGEFGPALGETSENLATQICDLVRKRDGLWGTAESCTGGWIAKLVTDNAGVSDVFAGGIVTYSNEMKMQLLGVQEETLKQHGAVSEATATEMVRGVTKRYGLCAGVAVTGIAGPTGGSDEKPVGTVHIASIVDQNVRHLHRVLPYGRRGMRERTVSLALNLLRKQLLERE